MNFDSNPSLENTSVFWLDSKKKSGIELCGPDTREWQSAEIIIGRVNAQIANQKNKDPDEEVQAGLDEAMRRQAYRKALYVAFHSSVGVTLNKEPVTKENAMDLIKAFTGAQLIDAINFLYEKESFLGKQPSP